MITAKLLKSILDYDPESGEFYWKIETHGYGGLIKVGDLAGVVAGNGYRYIGILGEKYLASRLVWLFVTGEDPESRFVEHKNGIKDDNRFKNLRLANQSQNMANTDVYSNSTSGFKGVSWEPRRGKWAAYIKVNYKKKFLGYYTEKADAARAYKAAAIEAWGEFANVPTEQQIEASRRLN